MYADLIENDRCVLLVQAAGTGRRRSFNLVRLLREMARYRVEPEPSIFRRSLQLAFLRRWWSPLSVALHDSIAAALDPSFDMVDGMFPLADAVDVWVQDPPSVSALDLP